MSGDGADEDVVEYGGGRRFPALSGGRRFPALSWRPPRSAAILAGAALLLGLAVGYAAGDRHAGGGAKASPRPAASAEASPVAVGPALIQDTVACSTRTGRKLQLGVQVTNQSTADVILSQVHVVLPLGGLRAVAQQWGPCGVLPAEGSVTTHSLSPGASAWFTVTFEVLMKCPGPLPVQFTVDYDSQGQAATVSLPGFPDLGGVSYPGCPATTG